LIFIPYLFSAPLESGSYQATVCFPVSWVLPLRGFPGTVPIACSCGWAEVSLYLQRFIAILGATQYLHAGIDRSPLLRIIAYRWCGWCSSLPLQNVL